MLQLSTSSAVFLAEIISQGQFDKAAWHPCFVLPARPNINPTLLYRLDWTRGRDGQVVRLRAAMGLTSSVPLPVYEGTSPAFVRGIASRAAHPSSCKTSLKASTKVRFELRAREHARSPARVPGTEEVEDVPRLPKVVAVQRLRDDCDRERQSQRGPGIQAESFRRHSMWKMTVKTEPQVP